MIISNNYPKWKATSNYSVVFIFFFITSCKYSGSETKPGVPVDAGLSYKEYSPKSSDMVISREMYLDKLYGFWLGQSIGNWTGLVTEMDKIGNIGENQTGAFYARDDWGKPDQPSVLGEGAPSNLSPTIDFVFRDESEVWGSDDDTDIEYMYQHLLYTNKTSILTAQHIKDGWLKHIKTEEENYQWVSNQKAFDLMRKGVLPPETSNPKKINTLK